jgi:cellulose synthase operon protein C
MEGRPLKTLVIILLAVCLGASESSRPSAQQAAPTPSFPASAWTAIAHGKLADAEALAKAQPATDAEAVAILAHLAARKGQYVEAVRMLEPAAAQAPLSTAALDLGLLQLRLGRAEAASVLLTTLFRQGSRAGDPAVLARAARAAQALGNRQDANSLFRAATATSNGDPAIETAWGWLFLETSTEAEAATSFQRVLKVDPLFAPAHAGLAAVLADQNPPAAAAAAMQALEIDPTLDSAELLLAQLDLDNTRYKEAGDRVTKVLGNNPNHLDAHALRAAIAHVKGDRATYDSELRKVLDINPGFGEFYRVVGDLLARNYRFEEAVAMTRKSVELDPTLARGYGDLGMHLLRTGDEAAARTALERSFNLDRTHRVTYNLLLMLDKLDSFTTVEGQGVIVRMSPEEAPVVREYAVPLAELALKTLSAKYRFTPKGPILVEIFPVHDDFAVRNLGLPGLIGALGACFGRVITMDSPKARPPGSFSWQATLWHEMAHVITLQMSQQRVPRWLTEGISVYEENKARPEWGREMEVAFAAALNRGKALPLKDLNAGFTSPETIALAYFQASVLVDHIVRTFGEEKLHALVKAYADAAEPDAAVVAALGQSMAQLQGGFDATVEQRFGTLRAALKSSPDVDKALQSDPEGLKAAAAANPGNFAVQLAYGRALASGKDRAAFQALERAAALVPVATGEESPHLVMAQLAEQLGDDARAVQEYLKLLAQDHTALEPARKLAVLAEKVSNPDAALVAYERVVALDPFDTPAHTGLGRLAMKKNQPEVAIREFKAAMALRPTDRAAAHCDLGEAYAAVGRLADAKKEALAALELAPSYERAQELLLKAIQGKPSQP